MGRQPSDFTGCSDEELVALARTGDTEAQLALVIRFSPLVSGYAARYAAGSGEFDDLVQEGMLALLDAAGAFDSSKQVLFRSFCGVCVSNRIVSVLRRQNSSARVPPSAVVPLDDESLSGGDLLDPQDLISVTEERDDLLRLIGERLSPFEADVIVLSGFGLSYAEIARRLSVGEKSVDNAVQRVRKKLKDTRV